MTPLGASWARFGLVLSALAITGCTRILGDFKISDKPVTPDAGPEAGPSDIIVTPDDGLQTTEWGGRTSFTIVLKTPPRSNVAIALSTLPPTSDDPAQPRDPEGEVSPPSVTFTPVNWSAPQTVFVRGLQDALTDGNAIYTVVTSPASTDDLHYKDMDPPDVAVLNIDDETPGFIVTPTVGLTTTESGGAATFTVMLTAPPAQNTTIVTMDLSSSLVREARVSPSTLAFTRANYHSPQTVTVTGLDDDELDLPRTFQVVTAPTKSSDPNYDGLNAPDVQVVNLDDESAGITITPTKVLYTSENGRTAAFSVVLDGPPTADVSVTLSSSNPREGTVSPARLTFTSINWRAAQTVTVTGVSDTEADGNQPYNILIPALDSGDARYKGIDPDDLDVINIDGDGAGVIVTPLDGLVTSEDGLTASFSVMLASPPSSDVTIDLTSSVPSEGVPNPRRITFTERNWNAPQIITVTGLDEDPPTASVADGNAVYHVRGLIDVASSDPDFGSLPDFEVDLVNLDNDSPGIAITPLDGLTTTEGGGKATFYIALRSKPTADVRVPLSTSNAAEGTVFPPALTFTPVNFAAPQKVTVTGVDDKVRDGAQRFMVVTDPATSNDDGYKNLDAPNVVILNLDDDTPGIIVDKSSDLTTTEGGGTATFTLQLATQPKSDVAINLSSSNAVEGEVTPGIVTFTAVNWNAPQTVTAVGKDDRFADGSQTYRIQVAPTTSSDQDYQAVDADDVTVTNLDDETPAVLVSADTPLVTTEQGGSATFSVVLASMPMTGVTLFLSSSRPAEGTVSPNTMTFSATNWRSPQVATIIGADDMLADGHQPYTIVMARVSSTDSGYNNLKPSDVAVINIDNDSPGVNVVAAPGLLTTESGGTAKFTVSLNSAPAAEVSIAVASSVPTEGTPSTSLLTFTAANWNAPQTVTVTGVDDAVVVDGARQYKIVLDPPKGDPAYANIDPSDVTLTNLDNDAPGVYVIPPKIATTTEFGGSVSFGVHLLSAPADTVTIPVASSNTSEGILLRPPLIFTTANWATPQWITVTGVDDTIADGDATYKITVGPALGTNSGYAGRRGNDVWLVNVDNEAPGLIVSPPLGPTTEGGIATNFTVSLATQPTSSVTVPITTSRPSEGMVLVSSLVFTPVNWKAPQTVTVRGIDDRTIDGDQPYRAQVGPTTSGDASNPGGDPAYKGRRAPDVMLINLDDDGAALRITAAPDLKTTELGGTAKFTVNLASAPSDTVTIPVVSRAKGEGNVTEPASGQLVFTTTNWSVAQTVTVTGVDDMLADGNVPYGIHFQAASSTDMRYEGRTADDVMMTNIDDDSAGVTIIASPNLTTTEAGGTATFRVVLNRAPTAGVTFFVRSSQVAEGMVAPGIVEFTGDNWNVPQTLTITGQQDTVADGNQVYAIVFDPAQSSDMGYREFVIDPIPVINLDDDTPAALAKQRRTNTRPRPASQGAAQPPR